MGKENDIEPSKVGTDCVVLQIGGGSQESNLPRRFLITFTSFEDWAAHQRPTILHCNRIFGHYTHNDYFFAPNIYAVLVH